MEYSVPGPDGKASESSERSMPQATSSAVIGLPSSHVASSRMVNVHSVKSSLGLTQVGRQVRDEDHLAGLVVAGVLGQRRGA